MAATAWPVKSDARRQQERAQRGGAMPLVCGGGQRRSWVAGSLVLACLPLACGQAPPAVEAPPPAPVVVVRPWQQGLDEWTTFSGTTEPLPGHVGRVTAAVEGTVASVLPASSTGSALAEGQHALAGQVIVQLDDRLARAQRAKVAASLKVLGPQQQQAENAVKLAGDTLRRLERLRKEKSPMLLVANADIEKAQGALRDAQAQLEAVKARLAGGAAELEALDRQLRLYTLRAPISGWLGTLQVVPGQTLAVGTTVAEVVDLDEIDVVCFAPPSRVGRLALGQPARMMPQDGKPNGIAPEGKVVYVAVQAAAQTGSFPVKVRFPNQSLHLRANAVVGVRIRTEPPRRRLVIPTDALIENQEPPAVVVVTDVRHEKGEKLGTARVFQAVLGVRNRQRRLAEILSLRDPSHKAAVPALDQAWFVVAGGHGLEDGDRVRVKEERPPQEAPPAGAAAAVAGPMPGPSVARSSCGNRRLTSLKRQRRVTTLRGRFRLGGCKVTPVG
jgi:multidrug efflux system membrane fusion protein